MRKFVVAAAALLSVAIVSSAVAAQEAAAAGLAVTPGKMIYISTGQSLAPVYRVTGAGDAQIILNGRLVTIPAASLSDVSGKLTTSLARKDISQAK